MGVPKERVYPNKPLTAESLQEEIWSIGQDTLRKVVMGNVLLRA
jgi:hypothetical protein